MNSTNSFASCEDCDGRSRFHRSRENLKDISPIVRQRHSTLASVIIVFIIIASLPETLKGFDLDTLTDSTPLLLSRQVHDIINTDELSENLLQFDDLTSLRSRMRKKLSEYSDQVKLVHNLGSSSSSGMSRHKRDTILADKLNSASRKRRNYAAQPYDLSILDGGVTHVVKRAYQLQHPSFEGLNVTDLNVIHYSDTYYLIAVQSNFNETVNTVFYKFLQNWELQEVGRLVTPQVVIVEVMEIEGYYYVLPAGYNPTAEYSLEGGSSLYRIDFKNNGNFNAVKIQAINTEFASSIIFWRSSAIEANDVILCVAPEKAVTSQGYRYKVNVSCYRWQGGYFDLTYSLPAYNPQAVSYMSIASHNYICVANYQDDSGSTNIFSTVFRYSHKKGNFLPFQKIQTYGAKDCKHFRFDSQEQVKEHYLAIANFGQVDENGKVDYNVKSYIFKFGVGRFILFQSLETVGAFQILPVQDGSKFLMIVGELFRLSIYQHNGWNFVKTKEIQFSQENLVNQFRMRPMFINNNSGTYFTVASPKLSTQTGIYGLEYEEKNDYVTMTKDLEEWCVKAVQNVESTDLIKLAEAASRVPNTTQPEIILPSLLTFTSGLHAHSIFTQSLQYNEVHFDTERSKSLARKEDRLDALETQINAMSVKLHNSISLSGNQSIKTKVEFSQWSVSSQSDINAVSVQTNQLNNIKLVDLVKDLVFLDQNYLFKSAAIHTLKATQEIQTQKLNGRAMDELVLKSTSKGQRFLEKNIFLKNVTAQKGFYVSGLINGVRGSDIVTVQSAQYFPEININSSTVGNLVATKINGVDMGRFLTMSVPTSGEHVLLGQKYFQNVSSQELWAQNNLSGYNIRQLYTEAVYLSNITKDTFTGLALFENVQVVSLETTNKLINNLYDLSKEFVSAKEGMIHVDSVKINNDANINTIDIKRNLNDIFVINNELDILLKNSSITQHVLGLNIHTVRLESPSSLEGKLNGIDIKNWSQEKVIHLPENPNIPGDVHGLNMTFSNGLTSTTVLQEYNNPHDLMAILQKSIPLNSPEFQCTGAGTTLVFESLKILNNSQIENINQISPSRDWIRGDETNEVIVEANKYFFGYVVLWNDSISTHGLEIPVDSSLQNFMEVFSQLQNILINGTDQVVVGNFVFNGLRVVNLTSDQLITLNGVNFNDILFTRPGQIVQVKSILNNGLTVKNSLNVVENVKTPFINGLNLESTLQDTLRTDSSTVQVIQGHVKFLDGLYLHDVQVNGGLGGYNIDDLFKNIVLNSGQDDHQVDIKGSLVFQNEANLSSLDYEGSMNGISPDQWGQQWMTRIGNQEITTPLYFANSLSVKQGNIIDSQVNNIDVTLLDRNILKKNQNGSIELGIFKGDVITHGDTCSKSMNGFDVTRDLLKKNYPLPQTIAGQKIFKGRWTILENLKASNLLNIDFVNMARFAYAPQDLTAQENLEVYGNCHSNIEPGIIVGGKVNGFDWSQVLARGWFSNEDTTIVTPIQLNSQSTVYLDKGGQVDGLIDGINLTSLDQSYLSLSRDQNWTGNFKFQSKVCMNQLDVEATTIQNGTLNGLDLVKFSWTTLLDGVEQNISSKLVTKQLIAPHLTLGGTVDGLDFCRNVVSVNGENSVPVSGLKTIQNLFAENLHLEPRVLVNEINLDLWRQLAITTSDDFVLTGDRKFQDAEFTNVIVKGLVDGKSINPQTVMTLSDSQTGDGDIKISYTDTPTNFAHIFNHGAFNGENLDEYFKNFVLINEMEPNQPLYVYGRKDIEGKVYTNWLKTEGQYEQDGINLLEFLSNYSAHSYIGPKYAVGLQEKYEEIGNRTTQLIQVATERAVMTKCFDSVSKITSPNGIVELRVSHALDKPMVAIVFPTNDVVAVDWYTYNVTSEKYDLNQIAQCPVRGRIVDFTELEYKEDYYLFGALASVNNTVVVSLLQTRPTSTDFILTPNATSKLSKGVILRLVSEEVNGKPQFNFVVTQIVFGDDFGDVLTFNLFTATGAIKQCGLFSVLDVNDFHALIVCFHSSDFQGVDDNAVHIFQTIPLTIAPQVRSLIIGGQTLIILPGSGNSTIESNGNAGVIDVWNHEQGDEPFVQQDCFPVFNIVSLDTILAPNDNPFLAVASGRLPNTNHFGLIFIYKYSVSKKKFVKYQTIHEENPIDVRFQRLIPSDETFLYVLTGNILHNVHVYSFKGVSGWNKEHSFTSQGGLSIEPSAFYYQGQYRAQALVINATDVNVMNANFNGVPYIPSDATLFTKD